MGFVGCLLAGLLLISAPAHARRGGGLVLYSSGDTVTQIADLPDDGPTGEANLGWKHYQFSLFWMPLWSGDGSYVVYEEDDDSYSIQEITEAQAFELAEATGVDPSPPGFLSLYWGWAGLLVLGVIALGLGLVGGDDDD